MFYQKLKNKVRFLEENLKLDITRMKMTEQVLGSVEKENSPKKTKGFWGLIFSKLGLQELGLFFRSVYLIILRLFLNLAEVAMIIFGDPAKSFNLLYKQHGLSACPIPYATFKTKQKHAKVFSLAGITTIILVTSMSALLVNLMVGPIEKTLAATYYWTQASWSGGTSGTAAVHTTDNDDWTYYASKDAGITAGASLTVTQSSADWTETSDADFNSYTSKDSSLSVGSNSITLLKPEGAACGGGTECDDGCCNGGVCNDDLDGDGYAPLACGGTDCDDTCFDCKPGSTVTTETPDGLDQDCVGGADDVNIAVTRHYLNIPSADCDTKCANVGGTCVDVGCNASGSDNWNCADSYGVCYSDTNYGWSVGCNSNRGSTIYSSCTHSSGISLDAGGWLCRCSVMSGGYH
jgi:hypothetical protein